MPVFRPEPVFEDERRHPHRVEVRRDLPPFVIHRERAVKSHRDGAMAGALGRVLQAWEQWDSAHQVYRRAQALAPRSFEWHYLDAIVLQRLARHGEAAARLKDALAISPDSRPAQVKLAD